MIAVLDSNIVASATYWRGKPPHCLEAWVLGKCDLAISHPIPTEYEEVIARLATRYPTKQPTDWLTAIKQAGHLYLPAARPASTADPEDEMFIECAAEAHADYLVTGDKAHLLALKQAPRNGRGSNPHPIRFGQRGGFSGRPDRVARHPGRATFTAPHAEQRGARPGTQPDNDHPSRLAIAPALRHSGDLPRQTPAIPLAPCQEFWSRRDELDAQGLERVARFAPLSAASGGRP